MSNDLLYAQYEAALVRLETTLPEMCMVIAALQLAMRHPRFTGASRQHVAAFVQGFIDQVKTLDLVIAQVLERGNDPHHDVPARRRKGRR